MYNWLVFLHILFAFLFMLGHGAHVAAMLKFRGEPDPERSKTFFSNVPDIKYVRYFTVAMGVFGLAAAFVTPWWKAGWPWISLVVFLIIWWVMYRYGGGYYGIISNAAAQLIEGKKTDTDLPAAQKRIRRCAQRSSCYDCFCSRTRWACRHPVADEVQTVLGIFHGCI